MKRFIELQTIETEKIKGSRFIVTTSPVKGEQGAKEIVHNLSKEHPNANHHCWALRLSSGIERSSDDGEPSGSAGEPILQRMRRAELSDSMVVVTRYFGGTKLGVGGLVRAYGGSAAEAITTVSQQSLMEQSLWTLAVSYSDQSVIKSIIQALNGKITMERYTDTVYLEVQTDPADQQKMIDQCRDRTAGRVIPTHLGVEWVVNEG